MRAALLRLQTCRAAAIWIVVGILAGAFFPARASDYLTDSWSGDDGLPNSSVTAIAQTPDGYLWVGTLNGLARFDGVRFVTFDPVNTPELEHARVFRLFVDTRGTLWINTFDGSLTSWRNGKFTHEWRGWDGMELVQMFTRSNDLVFATAGGELVSRTGPPDSPGQWRRFKAAGQTAGFYYRQDRSGRLWYNTRTDGAVGWLTGTNARLLPADCGLAGQSANCLEADASGRIWVGTDKGIAVWDGERFQNRTPTNGPAQVNVSLLFFTRDDACWAVVDRRVRKFVDRRWVAEAEGWGELFGDYMPALTVKEDREGGVWFCHYGQGVFHAKPDETFRRVTSADGLPGDRVACWLEDREGSVWLGVDRGGLVRLREKRFQVIGPAEGLPAQSVISVCEDHAGAVWIGTYGGGLNRWQGGHLVKFTLSERPTRGFFFSIYPDEDDRLWLSAGREDLYLLDQGRIVQAPSNVHGIKCTLVDRRGRVWLGKKAGLSRLSDGIVESFGQRTGFDYTVGIHALAEDAHGDIWAGAGNGVLYRFHDGAFTSYQAEDRLRGQAIWSLLPDEDGAMWVGTFRGGLSRFKDGEFTRYTMEDGLPSDVICQILDDGDGRLWIGSYKGIFHVSKTALNEFANGALRSLPCVTYGTYDGLPTLECSGGYQPSAWRGRDGRLWFATAKGVVSVRPDDLPRNLLPPPVIVEEMRVDGQLLSTNSSSLAGVTNEGASRLRIQPGRNFLEIRYTALSYVAPDQVRFRYRLEGLESAWVEAGARREAYYSHLPPGHYTFYVTACNSDGVWNEQGATLAFTMLPHFYETRWFLGISGLMTLAVIVVTVRHFVVRRMRREMERVERQRALERDRARIARDIHDDLGSGLTHIKLESEMARRNPARQTQEHLGQIARMAHGLTRKIDEIVWAVDPERDTLAGFADYATGYAEEFLNAADIRCRIDLPATLPEMHVDAETRYNLFLGLKEVLNNVARHSRASEVWLRLHTKRHGFTLLVEDNGCGISDQEEQESGGRLESGHGIGNLQKRLAAVAGKCVIHSVQGKGTRVEMTVRAEPSSFMAMGKKRSIRPE